MLLASVHKSTKTNRTHTPVKEEVSTGQHSAVSCGREKLVVFEPGHLGCWPAVWRPAGDCNVFSSLRRQVCGLLDETPVHLWKHNMCVTEIYVSHRAARVKSHIFTT